jgi:flagellar biosynthesis regulator FlaF
MPSIDPKAFLNESNVRGIDFFIANRKTIFKHIIDWQVAEEELLEEKRKAEKDLKILVAKPTATLNKREKMEFEYQKKHLMNIIRKEGSKITLETDDMSFAWTHREKLLKILEGQEALREKIRAPIQAVAGFILAPVRWISDSLANRWEEFEEISQEIRDLPRTLVNWL